MVITNTGVVIATTDRMVELNIATESVTNCKAYHGKSAGRDARRPYELDLEEC